MVSKASEDLPDPLNPVMTVKVLRGISTSIFFRLCWRAPCTVMRLSIGVGELHSNKPSGARMEQTEMGSSARSDARLKLAQRIPELFAEVLIGGMDRFGLCDQRRRSVAAL